MTRFDLTGRQVVGDPALAAGKGAHRGTGH